MSINTGLLELPDDFKRVERGDVRDLLRIEQGPCISIYMPVYRRGVAAKQNRIRFKNLLNRAENELHDAPAAILQPLRRLEDPASVWKDLPPGGLALFAAPGFHRALILAQECEEATAVGDRFLLAPLVRFFAHDGRFYTIALANNSTRLYEGTRDGLQAIELPAEAPASLDAMLEEAGTEVEKSLQHHAAPAGKNPGTVHGVLHGHGRPKDVRETLLLEYLGRLATGLRRMLGRERAPIVLAGVEYVQARFRKVFTHPYLLDDGVNGSPDATDTKKLQEKSWAIVEPWFERTVELAMRRYAELEKTQRTTESLEAIVAAADGGRIDTLFFPDGTRIWGQYDSRSGAVDVHARRENGDVDLSQLALEGTLGSDGEVFVLPSERLRSRKQACAILRW